MTRAVTGADSDKAAFSGGETGKRVLSLAKCRALLGTAAPELDADLARLRDQLYGLAGVEVEVFCKRRGKGSPHAPDACQQALKGEAMGKEPQKPANFPEALALLPEDERYVAEERAAIHEFHGGLDRSAAERLAFAEHWRAKHKERG